MSGAAWTPKFDLVSLLVYAASSADVETVMVINAFAVVEQQQGVSPYDHAIDVVNQDQEYYVQQVFPRGVKKLKIAANVYFSYYQGETWREAVDEGLQSNEGWTVTADDACSKATKTCVDGWATTKLPTTPHG